VLDYVLALVRINPFRCRDCRRRFRLFGVARGPSQLMVIRTAGRPESARDPGAGPADHEVEQA
jgi:hypothetical protein